MQRDRCSISEPIRLGSPGDHGTISSQTLITLGQHGKQLEATDPALRLEDLGAFGQIA